MPIVVSREGMATWRLYVAMTDAIKEIVPGIDPRWAHIIATMPRRGGRFDVEQGRRYWNTYGDVYANAGVTQEQRETIAAVRLLMFGELEYNPPTSGGNDET